MKRLEGKSIVITGAASGIGRASALLFGAQGARLLLVDRAPEVEATAAAVRAAGGLADARVADASDETDVAAFMQAAVDRHGALDGVFANAGISGGAKTLEELTTADWLRVLNVNLIGAFLAVKYAARVMVPAGRGAIVCTASVAGVRSGAGGLPYSASKAGVISLVQTTANQLGGTGVRINAVCPGLIETGMTQAVFDRARERGTEHRIGQLNPLRRGGQPHEIAQMAQFLISDDASYVNGQAVAVDGGLSSSLPVVPPRP